MREKNEKFNTSNVTIYEKSRMPSTEQCCDLELYQVQRYIPKPSQPIWQSSRTLPKGQTMQTEQPSKAKLTNQF